MGLKEVHRAVMGKIEGHIIINTRWLSMQQQGSCTVLSNPAAPIRALFYATRRAGVWCLIGALSQSLLHKHPLAWRVPFTSGGLKARFTACQMVEKQEKNGNNLAARTLFHVNGGCTGDVR